MRDILRDIAPLLGVLWPAIAAFFMYRPTEDRRERDLREGAALLFLVNQLATRGRIVGAGEYVSTGATTGVHKVRAGMKALADFGELGTFTAAVISIKP